MNIFIFLFYSINTTMWTQILIASENREGDYYDELGRNRSAHLRRQALVQWKTVARKERKKTNPIS